MRLLISSLARQLLVNHAELSEGWGAVGIHRKEFISFYPPVKPCLEDEFLFLPLTGETQVRAELLHRRTELTL